MTPSVSLYLDIVRAIAAIVVVFHHYSQHLIKAEFGRTVFPHIGQEAVIVFFVLSGFIISWVADKKEKSAVEFFIKRLARFYSVMIPAIVILGGCYWFTTGLEPELYRYQGDADLFLPKAILTLGFANFNSILHQVKLPGGSPFWSLTYEFWYYVAFALFAFAPKRWVSVGFTALIFTFLGWDAFLLWPVWLLGVGVYWASLQVSWGGVRSQLLFGLSLGAMVALYYSGWRYSLLSFETYLGELKHLRYAASAPYFWAMGSLISLNFLALVAWSKHRTIAVKPAVEKVIRRLAGVSFTLYLIHVPLMLAFRAIFGGYVFPYFIPSLTLVTVYVIGLPIERTRFWYQARFKTLATFSGRLVKAARALA